MQKVLVSKTHPFHTESLLENNKQMRPFQCNQKKMISVYQWKFKITSFEEDNLLRKRIELNNRCRHQNKFTLLRHVSKDYVFTKTFLAAFPSKQPFWSSRLIFCILRLSKQTLNSSTQRFRWKMSQVIFSVNMTQN